jgi:hypothetical protein
MKLRHAAAVGVIVLLIAWSIGIAWAEDPPPTGEPPAEEPGPETTPAPGPETGGGAYGETAGGEEPAKDDWKTKFTFNGFIQTQAGVFISQYNNEHYHYFNDSLNRIETYPREHGSHWGELSMFRNTLQLEGSWKPVDQVGLFAIFRGVRSAPLLADNFAQVPEFTADVRYNYDKDLQKRKREWVADHFYQETDLREFYVDIYPFDWWSWRIGRQQIGWGETANARLLDIINPIDSTWHLSVFEAYEDQRIPLWAANTIFDIQPINASLEFVYVPVIDDPEDRVTIPLTFVGAWGLPLGPRNEFKSELPIRHKKLIYPETNWDDPNWGARWKHVVGPFTHSLVYYHGHHMSPPIPKFAEQSTERNADGLYEVDVYLHFPRQDTYGLSMELVTPSPASMVFRVEAAYWPQLSYPMASNMAPGYDDENPNNWDPITPGGRANFYQGKWDTYSYALTIMRPNQIRWLNPTSSIITQVQLIQTIIPGPAPIETTDKFPWIQRADNEGPLVKEEYADGSKHKNSEWYPVTITGYDKTKASYITTLYTAGILTSYARGLVSPTIIGIYDENNKGGILSLALDFAVGNMWRFKVAYNMIEGARPYQGLGFFRDRDELNLRVRCQF